MQSAMTQLDLTPSTRQAFDRLAADARRVFGPRFGAVVAYGHQTGAIFADSIHADDLDALAALVETWHREGLATPLIVTPDEFRRSLDAFPLEYQSILDTHVVIDGTPPFEKIEVRPDDLRRACETQARSYLIHLRQGWLEAAGHHDDVAQLLAQSAQPFRALLSNVARLERASAETTHELATFAERVLGISATLVRLTLDLERHPEHAAALAPRMPEYLEAAEQLWDFVDSWKAQ
jgi:signal transduction histidine kinase